MEINLFKHKVQISLNMSLACRIKSLTKCEGFFDGLFGMFSFMVVFSIQVSLTNGLVGIQIVTGNCS